LQNFHGKSRNNENIKFIPNPETLENIPVKIVKVERELIDRAKREEAVE
jgi:hypothetical protein